MQAPRTASHDARARFTASMFQQMADGQRASTEPAPAAPAVAERVVKDLCETSDDLRRCALLAPDGSLLAASADAEWESRARELFDAGPGERPEAVHVATPLGELFAVRGRSGHAVVAVADRFALESLMLCDLRAALRAVEGAA